MIPKLNETSFSNPVRLLTEHTDNRCAHNDSFVGWLCNPAQRISTLQATFLKWTSKRAESRQAYRENDTSIPVEPPVGRLGEDDCLPANHVLSWCIIPLYTKRFPPSENANWYYWLCQSALQYNEPRYYNETYWRLELAIDSYFLACVLTDRTDDVRLDHEVQSCPSAIMNTTYGGGGGYVAPTHITLGTRWISHGSAVGWGTALQFGRSLVRFPMVSLEFFIDIILPAALWSWSWLSP